MVNKTGLMKILLLIIVILVMVIIYAFVVRPAITGYATNTYNVGVQDAVISIMQQAATCQQVPLTFGNQTMNVVWVECVNRALQQQTQPQ